MDAVIVAYVDRTDRSVLYSFDDGFDTIDTVTRLVTADSPFS